MQLDTNIKKAIDNVSKLDNIAQTMHDTEKSLNKGRSLMAQAYIHAHAAMLYTRDWIEENAEELMPVGTFSPDNLYDYVPRLRELQLTAGSTYMLSQLENVKSEAVFLGVKTL